MGCLTLFQLILKLWVLNLLKFHSLLANSQVLLKSPYFETVSLLLCRQRQPHLTLTLLQGILCRNEFLLECLEFVWCGVIVNLKPQLLIQLLALVKLCTEFPVFFLQLSKRIFQTVVVLLGQTKLISTALLLLFHLSFKVWDLLLQLLACFFQCFTLPLNSLFGFCNSWTQFLSEFCCLQFHKLDFLFK